MKNMDENDLLRAGLLDLNDPAADCDLVEPPPAPGETQAPDNELKTLGDSIQAANARLEARAKGTEAPIVTPWPAFNEALGGGLWPGLVVLTGNTGCGKTQWAMQLAFNAAKARLPVVYVALELDSLGLVCRLAALAARDRDPRNAPSWSDLYRGRGSYGDTLAHLDRLNLPFYLVEEKPGWKPDSGPGGLGAVAQAVKAKHPDKTPLVVLDFLQLVGGEPREELRERIGKAAYAGRLVARDQRAAVLLLSSTPRGSYNALAARNDKGDVLDKELGIDALTANTAGRFVGMGKESGEIEYAADLALVLVKPWTVDPAPWPVALGIAKQRAGREAWIKLTFDGDCFGSPKGGPLVV